MRLSLFIAVVLVSGAIAGTVQGTANILLVEPILDAAIALENKALFDSGEAHDTESFRAEHIEYRLWQKWGQLGASAILGMSFGALFGIVYAYGKKSLPGSDAVKKSIILAAIMWLVLFAVPFIKYPSNPPTVGDPDTVGERTVSYLGLVASSGLLAVGFYAAFRALPGKAKIAAFAGYACAAALLLAVFPANPDESNVPEALLYDFRMASAISITSFWVTIPFVLGPLWNRFLSEDNSG